RNEGDDRLVRVDEVGVALAAAPHPDEPEDAVHRTLLLVDAAAQELAGALLGAALAAGVVADGRRLLAPGAAAGERVADARDDHLGQESADDDPRGAKGEQHRRVVLSERRRRRGGRRSRGRRRGGSRRRTWPWMPRGVRCSWS